MKEEIETAIKTLIGKSTDCNTGDSALKYTQAVLNLAHVLVLTASADNPKK